MGIGTQGVGVGMTGMLGMFMPVRGGGTQVGTVDGGGGGGGGGISGGGIGGGGNGTTTRSVVGSSMAAIAVPPRMTAPAPTTDTTYPGRHQFATRTPPMNAS
jgi:hypothetical protein